MEILPYVMLHAKIGDITVTVTPSYISHDVPVCPAM